MRKKHKITLKYKSVIIEKETSILSKYKIFMA